jgi:hypothetical protein
VYEPAFPTGKHHIFILDSVETCVLGKGWELLSMHNFRRTNVDGFDHETAIKKKFSNVHATTAAELPDGQSVLLAIKEGIHNEISNHSLLSEFQLRDITIPLDLVGCMIHFRHQLPTKNNLHY